MGLFDIFKKTPNQAAIDKQVRKAKEQYAQSDYRRMAMDKLLKWDTDESLKGVLERFCVVVQSPHWDEEEKLWLVEEIVARGDKMMPLLRAFILEKNEVNHALIACEKILNDKEKYSELLFDALKARPPSDHRSVQGKQELISALQEICPKDIDQLLLPYLNDHSDDVQCAAIGALAESENEETKEKLILMLSSEVHSARVLRAAANVVYKRKFPLGENCVLSDVVREDFRIEGGFLVTLTN